MPVINTNTSAQYAQDALKVNAKTMSTAMQQLATGNRINAAKDDAAGLSIGQNMTSQVRGLNQAVRNVNDGINLLQTADGALVETSNMLQRMRELAVQASNDTNNTSDRSFLDLEFQALNSQINQIANPTMPEVGERYLGTVVKTAAFGAFISLVPGKDGLLHISEVKKLAGGKRVESVDDVLKVGDKIQVEIKEIDPRGKLSLVPVIEDGASNAGNEG